MSPTLRSERETQRRVVSLFISELGYERLSPVGGMGSPNIRDDELSRFLNSNPSYDESEEADARINRAIALFKKEADGAGKHLYDRNKAVYDALRYGVKVRGDHGSQAETVWLIDWKQPERNRFAVAEEVEVPAANGDAHGKRPDVVLYVNGIALAVIELKRASVSVSEGKDLFRSLEGAVKDYTSGALDGYDRSDVEGLLKDRLKLARERLDATLEAVRALCEPVEPPQDDAAHLRYFSSKKHGDVEQLAASEPQRHALYSHTAALVRAYANLASEMTEAGYTEKQATKIKDEVAFYEGLRGQVKLHSGDAVDLKQFEPGMRHLIDAYIESKESVAISAFDDLSLIQLIVERGAAAVDALPERTRKNRTSVAETIENNVRRLIVDQTAINPRYYGQMSTLLDALIAQRKTDATNYEKYLAKIVELTRKAKSGPQGGEYSAVINSPARRALFDNLGKDEALALAVDGAVRASRQDEWRSNTMKSRKVRSALAAVLPEDPELVDRAFELVKHQNEY